jgi:hypothetical protein
MKLMVAMILAASVSGCFLTDPENLAGPAVSERPLDATEADRPGVSAVKYDASWYKTESWAGEYPSGFTVDDDVTIKIRANAALDAPKSRSCALRKGATYHPWNDSRITSDQLKFVTFTRIETYKLKENYTSSVSRQPDGDSTTIAFKKGDRWSYLAGLSEGNFLMRIGKTTYLASQDLYERSTQVDAPADGKEGPDAERWHEWLRLKCANGAVGWIFLNDVKKAPGFSTPDDCGYGCAEDRKPGRKSPSNG